MLSFECPTCGEKKDIEPLSDVFESVEDLEIQCLECGYTGKPAFYISECKGHLEN